MNELDKITNEQIAYQEERNALRDRIRALNEAVEKVKRMRNIKESERIMSIASYNRDILALTRIIRRHYATVNG